MAPVVPPCERDAPVVPVPAMTRCECAGLSFAEVERRLGVDGASFEELSRRTGCGRTCTACLPDLRAYLAARRCASPLPPARDKIEGR